MVEALMEKVNQFVIFSLAGETYGVEINHIKEIITMKNITQVPGSIGFIEGIINLRGIVIPVFSIKKKFNIEEQEYSSSTRIVVVEVQGNTLGIIVDGVSEVLRISNEILEKPSAMIRTSISTDYINSIAKLEEKLVIILNLENVLGNEEKNYLEMLSH